MNRDKKRLYPAVAYEIQKAKMLIARPPTQDRPNNLRPRQPTIVDKTGCSYYRLLKDGASYRLNNNLCNKTSVNCVHTTFPDKFVKLRVREDQDPLLLEVINMKILNEIEKREQKECSKDPLKSCPPKTFLAYKKHCLTPRLDVSNLSYKELFLCETLETEALPSSLPDNSGWTSLGNFFRNDKRTPEEYKQGLQVISRLIRRIKELKMFTHNDLHLGNVLVKVSTNNPNNVEIEDSRMIDYGRMWIFPYGINNELAISNAVDASKAAFGDQYKDFTVEDYLNDPDLQEWQIKDPTYGYLCDMTTLTLNALYYYRGNGAFKYPSWIFPYDVNKTGQCDHWYITRRIGAVYQYAIMPRQNRINYIISREWALAKDAEYMVDIYDGLAWFALFCDAYANRNISRRPYPKNRCLRMSRVTSSFLFCNHSFNPAYYDVLLSKIKRTFISQGVRTPFPQSGGAGKGFLDFKGISTGENPMPSKHRVVAADAEDATEIVQYFNTANNGDLVMANPGVKQTTVRRRDLISFPEITYDEVLEIFSGELGKPETDEAVTDLANDVIRQSGGYMPSGGGRGKARKIYTDPKTKRRYVRKAKAPWYLDEHRGKYRYTNNARTHITIVGDK